MEQRSYYAIIPANVRYDDDLTPNAKLMYGEITALCNEKGCCWATNKYFAELYKVSEVSISKWVNQLVKNGYIKSVIEYKEGTKQILNRYLTIVNDPIKEKFNTPIKEKFKDNNTNINNTINKENIKRKITEIFDYWNSKKIITHKEINAKRESIILKALKEYNVEDIKTCIDHYNEILNDKTYFYKYKWSLDEFLERKNGISCFTEDGSKWVSYLEEKKKNKTNANAFVGREYKEQDFSSLYTDLDNIEI